MLAGDTPLNDGTDCVLVAGEPDQEVDDLELELTWSPETWRLFSDSALQLDYIDDDDQERTHSFKGDVIIVVVNENTLLVTGDFQVTDQGLKG
jgi:protein involved in polysaccharide export with SLBB domain